MECKRYRLYEAYLNLLELNDACSASVCSECQNNDLTRRQIYYLRVIDSQEDMTASRLADITSNSKPTITELVNRLIAGDCVYKEKSSKDRRVCYIHLTPKGKKIARSEELTQLRLVEHIEKSLTEDEVNTLIELLNKLT